MTNSPTTISDDFLPRPFYVADKKSVQGQRSYKNLFRLELGILIAAAVISIWPVVGDGGKQVIAVLLALLFLAELIIRVYIHRSGVQDNWYYGRAIAESIKTLTWKFAMRPYSEDSEESKAEAHENFNAEIHRVLKHWPKEDAPLKNSDVNNFVSTNLSDVKAIVDWRKKRELYHTDRIIDQQRWYINRAKKNEHLGSLYYYLMIGCYGGALLLSIYFIYRPNEINLVPIFTVLASSILGWTQLNHFKDLRNAYSVATNEINEIIKQMANTTEDSFYQQVEDTENAFSREHTVWIARKDAKVLDSTVNPE